MKYQQEMNTKKDTTLKIRISHLDKQEVRNKAKKEQRTISSYVRKKITGNEK